MNKRRVQRFFELARDKGCTPSQLALAWVHGQGEDVFPIPGTKSSTRIVENAGAVEVLARLSPEEMQSIADCVPAQEGERNAASYKGLAYNARV